MVLSGPINMFLSKIDLVCPATAGLAASQNSPPSSAPTRTIIALADRVPCFVERIRQATGEAISRLYDNVITSPAGRRLRSCKARKALLVATVIFPAPKILDIARG